MPRYAQVSLSAIQIERKPDWLRVRLPSGENFMRLRSTLWRLGLHTVCEEALCPNMAECWGGGTSTIMIMGDTCTRGCRFCNVMSGKPKAPLDPLEPMHVAKAVKEWGLSYVVLTSVDRDDLEDGGAGHFAETVRAIKREEPTIIVEVLMPDFLGDLDCIRKIVDSGAEVIAHNVETSEYLTPMVRDRRAGYCQSLQALRIVKRLDPKRYTKSSMMLGLGESDEEVEKTMVDLRRVGVDILTLGQYLQPSRLHLPVKAYVHPSKFEEFRKIGEEMGFLYVAAGPLVRSSYRAGEFFLERVIRESSPLAISQ